MKQVFEIETKKGITGQELMGCLEDTMPKEIISIKTPSITIPLSEEDLQELLHEGKVFNWNFDGIDVKLEQGEEE